MKCEMCHESDAETAIHVNRNGSDEELYVCKACASKERVKRQKKSQRTRKPTGDAKPDVSISVSGVCSGDEPPPIVKAIMSAFGGMVGEIEKAEGEKRERREPKWRSLSCDGVDGAFRLGKRLHLEGLHLIGELEAVDRAVTALKLRLEPVEADCVKAAAHVFRLMHAGSCDRAKRVLADLVREERNARVRLFETMPRVFGDALSRSLAILKNCRLLSPGELFDLLSPMRLAAIEGLVDGITREEIESIALSLDLKSGEDHLTPDERDKADAVRADEMNARFEEVFINEKAEGKFL